MLKQYLYVTNDNKLEIHHNLVFLNCVDLDKVNRQPQRVDVSGISPTSEQMTKGWCSNDANLHLFINLVDKSVLKSLVIPPPTQHHSFFSNLPPLTICELQCTTKKNISFV